MRSIPDLFDNVSKLTWFLSGSAKRKETFLQTAAATDDSELLGALVACADEDEEDLSKHWKREASDRLYRNSVLLVGVQKLLPSLLFLLNMAL